MNMLGFSLGVTRVDKIRNEYIRGTARVGRFGDKAKRPRWFKDMQRRDLGYIWWRMLEMELPGKRRRGRLGR